MAINKLTKISGTCAGVVLPLDELREEGLVEGVGNDLELTGETQLRITRFHPGAWQVLRTDIHDYPAFHEKQAYAPSEQRKGRV